MFYSIYSQEKKRKNYLSYIAWFLIPIFLGVLVFLFATNKIDSLVLGVQNFVESIPEKIETMGNKRSALNFETPSEEYLRGIPIKDILRGGSKYEVSEAVELPNIDAESYVVGDVLTGEIILEKNRDLELPIASLTKLMTASVALDEMKETHVATVSQKATLTESSRGMLRAQEKIEVSDLLYPLLLVSSNDSAEVLAETFGRKYFIQSMNRRAREIGMNNTSFDDPSGLSEHNVSTAEDMFKLSEYLFNNHTNVFEITKLKEYTQGGRVWKNANRFAGTTNYEGGKTGYTSKAHRTGVALFRVPIEGYGERVLAISLLRTDNRAEDYSKLLSFVEEHVRYITPAQANWEEQASNEVAQLVFMGDMMFDRGVKNSVYKEWNEDYARLFDNLKILKEADVAFANLEGPISDRGTNVGSKYSFRFEPVIAEVLKEAGIDIVSFANNHVGDWSLVAFQDTLDHLQKTGVLFTGAGKNRQEASEVTILESKGIKIGFLGFSDVGPNWLEAKENEAGQLLASDPKRLEYIEDAKSRVDILVVSYHWGDEYKKHNQRQTELARSSIDAGANLVIGHHPHVAQDIEIYKGGLIAYSLGNAIFDQHFSEETMQGLLLEVSVNAYGVLSYEENTVTLSDTYQPQKPQKTSSTPYNSLSASLGSFDGLLRSADALIEANEELCPKTKTRSKNLLLFNTSLENKIPENFVPENLVPIPDSHIETLGKTICVNTETLEALYAMHKDAKEDGVSIVPTSGYRSFDTQEQLFAKWKERAGETKYLAVAPPGHSEHHLGTTIDFTSSEIDFESATEAFEETKAYLWLQEHASRYGFVQSYQEGAEDITGYIPESWHWRYVGTEHAENIQNRNLTIVEYLSLVE